MKARLTPATITNRVAARPVTVIAAIVGVPLALSTSKVFAASMAIRAMPRATSTPRNRVFVRVSAGGSRSSWPGAFAGRLMLSAIR